MMKELTVEWTAWLNETEDNTWNIPRPALKPLTKVWYHFVRHRFIPNTHMETVDKDRLVLLSCILSGKKINVGANNRETNFFTVLSRQRICFSFHL